MCTSDRCGWGGFTRRSAASSISSDGPLGAPANMGLLIALAYRLCQISIATIGVGYWLAGRREVDELMHEAEELPPEDELDPDPPSAIISA